MKTSEKILLNDITQKSKSLHVSLKNLSIGELVYLYRKRLKMSQQTLANRAKIPQSTLSKIEKNKISPNISTIRKIFEALFCSLVISAVPLETFDVILSKQAKKKAKERIKYLTETMSLEKQKPDKALIEELIKEEEQKLLNNSSYKLWNE